MTCYRIHKGDLDAYVHGELSAEENTEIEAHLVGCSDCAIELRYLRREQTIFRVRADSDKESVPALEDVLTRIHRGEVTVEADITDLNREVDFAKNLQSPPLPRKNNQARPGERKYLFSRWSQAVLVSTATAAAAWTLFAVTPPKTEERRFTEGHQEEMEIGADPICTLENSSASAEVLASMPPLREVSTKMPEPNDDASERHHSEDCDEEKAMERICGGPSSSVCSEQEQ